MIIITIITTIIINKHMLEALGQHPALRLELLRRRLEPRLEATLSVARGLLAALPVNTEEHFSITLDRSAPGSRLGITISQAAGPSLLVESINDGLIEA